MKQLKPLTREAVHEAVQIGLMIERKRLKLIQLGVPEDVISDVMKHPLDMDKVERLLKLYGPKKENHEDDSKG